MANDTANDQNECRLPTPFAEPSWEPRVAIDASENSEELIMQGLQCCLLVGHRPYQTGSSTLRACVVSPTRLAIAPRDEYFPGLLPEPAYFETDSLQDAAQHILLWLLREAQYPKQPWFDGGEVRGFQMYYVPWLQSPREYYGYTLIEPKWFEVHK